MSGGLLDLASWVLILAGCFFTVVGALGIVRMPELFTRIHAASVIDTVGAVFLVAGMMLQAGLTLVSVKLLFILGLLFFTGPVITHALAQAALAAGIKPHLHDDRRERPLDDTVSPPAPIAAAAARPEPAE